MTIADSLARLGFGEYEARAYIALLQQGAVTGYELARVSGIPRANIYGVLQKLEERIAVTRIESPEGARYAAVPAEELLARLERQFQQTVEGARVELAQLARPVEPSYVWNLSGYTVALEHAQSLLAGSEHQLLLGLYPEEAAALEEAIAGAEARGLPITTLCMAGCATPCGGCRGTLHRYRQPTEAQERWLLVVADGAEALAAEIRDESGAMAMRSRQPLLVKLTGWFIRHTITLATLVNALGSRLEQQSDTEAESVLTPDAEDWLTTLRGILRESPARP